MPETPLRDDLSESTAREFVLYLYLKQSLCFKLATWSCVHPRMVSSMRTPGKQLRRVFGASMSGAFFSMATLHM